MPEGVNREVPELVLTASVRLLEIVPKGVVRFVPEGFRGVMPVGVVESIVVAARGRPISL